MPPKQSGEATEEKKKEIPWEEKRARGEFYLGTVTALIAHVMRRRVPCRVEWSRPVPNDAELSRLPQLVL